jgi:hypothetical protein
VFGIDCASATFDRPASPSFVEQQIERVGGGAVAGFGDTRNSPSNPNSHMGLGMIDALFPSAAPGFGSSTPSRRLGDVLLSGKAYMASQAGFEGQSAGDTEFEHYLYHLLGDPSMQMWAATPTNFDPAKIDTKWRDVTPANPGDPVFQVEVNFAQDGSEPPAGGTVVTLFHGSEVIGRGIVGDDGRVTINPDVKTDTRSLTVALNQDGVLPAHDTVDQGNPAQPTSLSLSGPSTVSFGKPAAFGGTLSPAFADAPVKLVYTFETTGATVEHTATTSASGDYGDTITIPRNQRGSWHVQASYAGDATHGASSSPVLTFNVP